MVKACLRIDLLVRIRYIVETMRPEAGALLSAASILTRLARHSADAAVAIVNCPRLVAALVASHLAASRCTSPGSLPLAWPVHLLFSANRFSANRSYQLFSLAIPATPIYVGCTQFHCRGGRGSPQGALPFADGGFVERDSSPALGRRAPDDRRPCFAAGCRSHW